MGQFEGKVAFITGAGRGQGRSHSVAIAAQGGDLALVDIGAAGKIEKPDYHTATSEELQETKALCESHGVRVLTFEADVRDYSAIERAVKETASTLGGVDYVVANAGIADGFKPLWEIPLENWNAVVDVNLTGVFHTCKAAIPEILKRGDGGSLVLVSSAAGIKAFPNSAHYSASKFGVRALAWVLALELGPLGIRCNSIHPGSLNSPMLDQISRISGISREEFDAQFKDAQCLPDLLQPQDTTEAVVWLLSDAARLVTGLPMCVDAGMVSK